MQPYPIELLILPVPSCTPCINNNGMDNYGYQVPDVGVLVVNSQCKVHLIVYWRLITMKKTKGLLALAIGVALCFCRFGIRTDRAAGYTGQHFRQRF